MFKELASKLFLLQCKYGVISKEKRELYEYAYRLLLRKTFTYTLLFVIGQCAGILSEMIIVSFFFIILRQYAGGIHLEKVRNCIVVSAIVVTLSSLYIHAHVKFHLIEYLAFLLSLLIILFLAPIDCYSKQLKSLERKYYRRKVKKILLFELIVFLITYLLNIRIICKGIIMADSILAVGLICGYLKNNFMEICTNDKR